MPAAAVTPAALVVAVFIGPKAFVAGFSLTVGIAGDTVELEVGRG